MKNKNQKYNLIQRVVFFIGLIALMGLVSVLLYEMILVSQKPPELEISTVRFETPQENKYQVWIQNSGEITAENTSVLLNLYQEGEITDSGTIFLNYVPPGAKAEAWIVFHREAKPGDSLVVASVTYLVP